MALLKPLMTDEKLLQELTEIFRQIFDDDSIVLTPGTTPNEIPEWDSVNHVSLLTAVELRFGFKFLTAETEDFKTVGDFVSLIQKDMAAQRK